MMFASLQNRLAFTLSHQAIKGFPQPKSSHAGLIDRIGSGSGDIGLHPEECHGIDEKYRLSKRSRFVESI